MSIKQVINQIEDLEGRSILKSKVFIDQYGWGKLKETLDLYIKGLSFGIPEDELESLFKVEEKNTSDLTDASSVESFVTYPEDSIEDSIEDLIEAHIDVIKEEEPVDQPTPHHFLNNELIHKALYRLSDEGVLSIMSNQICDLAGVDQSKGNLKKITQGLEQAGFKSKYASNPLKFTRTRANLHEVDLNNLTECLNSLWKYLSDRRDKNIKLPIKIEDYLDGTEGSVKLKRDKEDLFIAVGDATYNNYFVELTRILEKVYGHTDQLVGGEWVENTELNKYLLSEALLKAFPSTTLRRTVKKEYPELDNFEVEGTVQHLRDYLNDVQVKVGLLNDNWSSIDTAVSGFVYLVVIMSLNYHMNQ